MNNRIITISREFGSGGRTIGKKAAEKLGIPCYDREIIEKLALKSGFSKDYIQEESRYAPQGVLALTLADRKNGLTNQDKIWAIQHDIICQIAESEACVIVGRCADYILHDKADCLRVFIHANIEKRAERIVKEYGEQEQLPLQRLKNKDKHRAAYYQFYTDMKWGKAQNYHISLDSGEIGIEQCAEILKQLY